MAQGMVAVAMVWEVMDLVMEVMAPVVTEAMVVDMEAMAQGMVDMEVKVAMVAMAKAMEVHMECKTQINFQNR